MNPIVFLIACLVASVAIMAYSTSYLMTIAYLQTVHADQSLPKSIAEDQIIICVNKADQIDDNGLVCHIGLSKDVDWYQDLSDGSFFKAGNSADMELLK